MTSGTRHTSGAPDSPGSPGVCRVRIELPSHLRTLAGVTGEVAIEFGGEATLGALFDALEGRYPKLRGTIRDHGTGVRRAYMRYFADRRDLSHEALDAPLPDRVSEGQEVFRIVGAIAGG